jgi:hypothetical protein
MPMRQSPPALVALRPGAGPHAVRRAAMAGRVAHGFAHLAVALGDSLPMTPTGEVLGARLAIWAPSSTAARE